MRYLLDTHALTNRLIQKSMDRKDLFVLQEVVYEYSSSETDTQKIRSSGIEILDVSKKHLDRLIKIMSVHGGNLKLISLFAAKGQADVVMLAYVLAEKEAPESLFSEEYAIVTKDKELTSVAKEYGIKCIPELDEN